MDEFLTVAQVAETLQLSQQTVRNWIDRGELKAIRVGKRRVSIRREDLDALLEAGTPAERDQLDVDAPSAQAVGWERVGAAMEGAVEALRGENPAELSSSLRSLSRAARALAKAIDRDTSA